MLLLLQKRILGLFFITMLILAIGGCASTRRLNAGIPAHYTISDFAKPHIIDNMPREEVHALLSKPQYTTELESGLEDEWIIIDPGNKFDEEHLLKKTANFFSAGIYALFTEPQKRDTGRKIQTTIRIRYDSEYKVNQVLFD